MRPAEYRPCTADPVNLLQCHHDEIRMGNDPLPRLSRWFAAHCDGKGEHQHGTSIQTTDNTIFLAWAER